MTWTTFGALSSATMAQLDGNYLILSGLVPVPCSVAGTNTLTLTSIEGAATLSAYANYIRFTGIAANTNSGAVTAQFGSFAALNVYKDTPAGPVVLAGNEIVQNNEFTLIYDLALNAGGGGFHLKTGGSELRGQTITAQTLITSDGMTVGSALIVGTSVSIAGLLQAGGSATIAGPLLIGASAAAITRHVQATATVAFAVTPYGTVASVTVSLPGASVGDVVGVGWPVVPPAQGFVLGYIGAASSVILKLGNAVNASTIAAFTTTMRVNAVGYT